MTEPSIESSLETLNLTGQQQPSLLYTSADDDIDELLANDPQFLAEITNDSTTSFFDQPDVLNHIDINTLIDSSDEPTDPEILLQTQFSSISIDSNDILSILESCEQGEPVDYATETQQLQQSSVFIENYDPLNFYPSVPLCSSVPSVAVGSSPVEPKVEDGLQDYLRQQNEIYQSASQAKKRKGQRKVTVAPVDYIHSGGCQPCTTVQVQNDYVYEQPFLQYDTESSKKIQIRCQPRSKFRPRTQNESKTSSHYLRCEDDVKPEYPTINIPQKWLFESDVNLIEVALMGLDKLAHPYTLYNKHSSDTYEDNVLIFKQNDPNVLYFRLTNEDFQNGCKTLLMELIKGKQDDVITKDLIRTRQLEHSMLRFTRIFQIGKGNFQRDEGSVEYSTVMSEAYGDVEVEHMGPRYGPVSGQEMVYVVLKGRILKNDLKIQVMEPSSQWTYTVENFTKNGNVAYFLMPAYPYLNPQCETIKAYIAVYYKDNEIFQTPYLYKGSLDRDLAELNLNDANSASSSLPGSNQFNAFNFLLATGARRNSSSGKSSTAKAPKRLRKPPSFDRN